MRCGGSIYSEGVIITAAHCCVGILENNIFWDFDNQIIAGELSIQQTSEYEQISTIDSFIIHPEYNKSNFQNDVCLLYLKDPFDLTGDMAKSIDLAKKDPQVGTTCDISGWGALEVLQIGKGIIHMHIQKLLNMKVFRQTKNTN